MRAPVRPRGRAIERDSVAFRWVAAAGVVTVALVFALGFALFPGRPWKAIALGTTICAPFVAIIGAGIRGWRIRRMLPPEPAPVGAPSVDAASSDALVIDLSATSASWLASRRHAPIAAGGAALAMALWLGVAVVWWMGLAIGGIALLVIPFLVSQDRPAVRAVRSAGPRRLRLDDAGLTLPIECLGGGVVARSAARGEADVRVAWSEIVAWETYGHQHVLEVVPDAARFGPFPRFALARVGEVAASDEALVARARRHLSVPIEVRTDGP